MSDWSLTAPPPCDGARGIAGYAVLDALGVRLGYVTGWVKDPGGRLRMIKLSARGWFEATDYLVPTGAVTLIDDESAQFHLRELTSRTIRKYCISFDGELPEPRLLKSLIRYFPNPRPSVVERLEQPEEVPSRPAGRLTIRGDRGDGAGSIDGEPLNRPAWKWTRLSHHVLPDWTSLSDFLSEFDLSQPNQKGSSRF